MKFALAGLLQKRGAVFLHAAAIGREGDVYLISAPSGSGKSSLAFNAATLAGFDYISEDLVYLTSDGSGRVEASGWPHRIGISSNVIAGHPSEAKFATAPLRRHPLGRPALTGELPAWGGTTRQRFYLDLDEFQDLTGARVAASGRLAGVVLPFPDEQRTQWLLQSGSTGLDQVRATSEAPIDVMKFQVDFLGILPALPVHWTAPFDQGCQLPTVEAHYGPTVNSQPIPFWKEITELLLKVGAQ